MEEEEGLVLEEILTFGVTAAAGRAVLNSALTLASALPLQFLPQVLLLRKGPEFHKKVFPGLDGDKTLWVWPMSDTSAGVHHLRHSMLLSK